VGRKAHCRPEKVLYKARKMTLLFYHWVTLCRRVTTRKARVGRGKRVINFFRKKGPLFRRKNRKVVEIGSRKKGKELNCIRREWHYCEREIHGEGGVRQRREGFLLRGSTARDTDRGSQGSGRNQAPATILGLQNLVRPKRKGGGISISEREFSQGLQFHRVPPPAGVMSRTRRIGEGK